MINKEIFDQIVKEGSEQEIDVTDKTRERIETDVKEGSQQEIQEIIEEVKRRKIETARLERSPKFKHQVMEVYKHQCAMCGIQIGIIEAAHIWEVRDEGTDEVCNGIALCPNHHDAFDINLITLDTQYHLDLNPAIRKLLKESKWDKGLEEILSEKMLRLPTDERYWPKKEYIERRTAYFKSKHEAF